MTTQINEALTSNAYIIMCKYVDYYFMYCFTETNKNDIIVIKPTTSLYTVSISSTTRFLNL